MVEKLRVNSERKQAMAKYIKCSLCGKPIIFGEEVLKYPRYCGLYCSTDCFAESYADFHILDEDIADDCRHEVYDDEERKKELRDNIAKMQMDLKIMQAELAGLEECSV
jgi:hypothetical protein